MLREQCICKLNRDLRLRLIVVDLKVNRLSVDAALTRPHFFVGGERGCFVLPDRRGGSGQRQDRAERIWRRVLRLQRRRRRNREQGDEREETGSVFHRTSPTS